jgi:hypothetical protein
MLLIAPVCRYIKDEREFSTSEKPMSEHEVADSLLMRI